MSNKKNKIYKRKDTRFGIYTATFFADKEKKEKEIKIIDNGLYTTNDKDLIKFFNDDPEIIEYFMTEGDAEMPEEIDDKINDEDDQGEID